MSLPRSRQSCPREMRPRTHWKPRCCTSSALRRQWRCREQSRDRSCETAIPADDACRPCPARGCAVLPPLHGSESLRRWRCMSIILACTRYLIPAHRCTKRGGTRFIPLPDGGILATRGPSIVLPGFNALRILRGHRHPIASRCVCASSARLPRAGHGSDAARRNGCGCGRGRGDGHAHDRAPCRAAGRLRPAAHVRSSRSVDGRLGCLGPYWQQTACKRFDLPVRRKLGTALLPTRGSWAEDRKRIRTGRSRSHTRALDYSLMSDCSADSVPPDGGSDGTSRSGDEAFKQKVARQPAGQNAL